MHSLLSVLTITEEVRTHIFYSFNRLLNCIIVSIQYYQCISVLLSTLKKNSEWTKVCKPDVFDGSDTRKLQPFLVQCTLNFRNHPDAFSTDSAKVTFALSFLKGTVLDWFEPSLTSGLNPAWLNDYSDFILELRRNFGPHDPEGKAEANLENLRMCNNQRIVKYLIDFNQLAAHVQWGKAALRRQLYHGLPS